jgi:alkaline phosphatase D
MDAWDGYTADRQRLFDTVTEQDVKGFVAITGDAHTNYASDLKADFEDESSPNIGVELMGTSISSAGDGSDTTPALAIEMQANPHFKFSNFNRGYVRCEIGRDQLRADYRVVPYISRPGADISTRASFVTEREAPGLQPADSKAQDVR